MSEGIRLLRNNGLKTGAAKSIMRVLLLGALGLPCEAMSSASIGDGGYGTFATFAVYVTVICLVAGVSFFLGTQYDVMKDEYRRIMVNQNLKKVLKLLKRARATMTGNHETDESESVGEESEEEIGETDADLEARYKNSEMCEVSDPELWVHYNHGESSPSSSSNLSQDPPHGADETSLHRAMIETNEVLTAREQRLEAEWDEAELRNDYDSMCRLENQILETRNLRYSI